MQKQMKQQQMYPFYDWTDGDFGDRLPLPPTEDDIRNYLAPNNSRCPLNGIIYGEENEGNLRILQRFAYQAFRRPNRSLRGCNFGIYAQSGQGKTHVVREFVRMIGIPFVFVQSASLQSNWSLLEQILNAHKKHLFKGDDLYQPWEEDKNFPEVVRLDEGGFDYKIPPCVVFFDEAHQIPKKMMEGSLLNAMERNDGVMLVRPPGQNADLLRVDCSEICWVAATTERGRLFDAYENRLGTVVEWKNAAPEQVAQIVQMNVEKDVEAGELTFTMPEHVCLKVAKYRKVPRESIDFARAVVQQKDMIPSYGWDESIAVVAADLGIDEWGFTEKQVMILTALGQRPTAEGRLPLVAKCRIEQVQKYELPMLMSHSDGGPYILPVSGKGLAITEAGLLELEKRQIDHKGKSVTAEHFEEKRR